MLKDLYFTDVYGMASKLKSGEISDATALKNFLLFMIIFSYSYEIPVNLNIYPTEGDPGFLLSLMFWFIAAAINYYGLRLSFNINNGGDGSDFFKRFCALSLPASFITTLYFMAVIFVLCIVIVLVNEEVKSLATEAYVPIAAVLICSYLLVFYRIMNKNIAIASGNT